MAGVIAAVLLLVAPSIALAGNWPFNNRRHYWIAHNYVSNIFRSLQTGGLLLTFDWEVASPIFYAQQVEQRRRDVKVVDINLLRRSWYFDYLKSAYPDLIERSREQVDSFVAELKNWEQDETAYAENEAAQRISSKFEEMIASFVKQEMQVATAYVTLDFLAPEELDRKMTSSIMERYGLVPQGLVFKLVSDRTAFRDPRRIRLETRGLNDGTFRFEKEDVVKTKVFPVYVLMLVNRGRYLASFGQHQRAVPAFKEALSLDPGSQDARRGLQESESKLPAR
jgi:tetratricopeptide (TPR) repeat protein